MDHQRVIKWSFGLAIAVLVATTLLPTYYINSSHSVDYETHYDFYPFGYNIYGPGVPDEMEGFKLITDTGNPYASIMPPSLVVFFLLNIVGVVALSAKLFTIRRRARKGLGPVNDMLCGVAILSVALNPLLFFIIMNGMLMNLGFWANDQSSGITLGPNVGWYLSFVTPLLVFLGVFYTWRLNRGRAADEPTVPSSPSSLPAEKLSLDEKKVSADGAESSEDAVAPLMLCGRCGESITVNSLTCPYCGVGVKRSG